MSNLDYTIGEAWLAIALNSSTDMLTRIKSA